MPRMIYRSGVGLGARRGSPRHVDFSETLRPQHLPRQRLFRLSPSHPRRVVCVCVVIFNLPALPNAFPPGSSGELCAIPPDSSGDQLVRRLALEADS